MAEALASNTPEVTVTELSGALKRTIEDRFGYVRVRGEISNYRGSHSSGHVYFSLKDQGARIDAVIWRGVFGRLRVRPEEGMEVIATGKVTTFPGKSAYQIVIEAMEPAGVGALMALLDARRRALAAEGLFDAGRKQLLPYLPRVIGIVTSPTGAVIRDILHRLADRFPMRVIVWPVRVQGETSAREVADAIDGFNALPEGGAIPRPDVLIVARGGGSLEDLWSFNEEIVVRAAARSMIPLVSAVGHETDTTLIDHAADVRAPTPTAAAELCAPVRSDLLARVADLEARRLGAMRRLATRMRAELRAAERALPGGDALLAQPRQRLDRGATALTSVTRGGLDARRLALGRLSLRLAGQSPHARMARVASKLEGLDARLTRALDVDARRRAERLAGVAARLKGAIATRARFATEETARRRERLGQVQSRLRRGVAASLADRSARLAALDKLRVSLGYRSVLQRGFALVHDASGALVRSAAIGPGQRVRIDFADGGVDARTEGAEAKPRRKAAAKPGQDSLF
jgi:exodeoxyribonuclease VII large subunit